MTEFPDWGAILPVSGSPLPLAEDPDFHWAQPSTVRGLFLNLEEIVAAIPKRKAPGAALFVCVDVLRIDSAVEMKLPAVVLHARRIEAVAGGRIQLSSADEADPARSIEMYADEWVCPSDPGGLILHLGGVEQRLTDLLDGGGVRAGVTGDGSLYLHEVGEAPAGDAITGQLQLITAKRLAYGREPSSRDAALRDLPTAIAGWVARTGADPLLRSDAQAFASHLRSPHAAAPFVPYLRQDEYSKLAESTQTALTAVDDEWSGLLDRQLSVEDQKKAAENLLEHYRNASAYSAKLLEQARDDVKSAEDARDRALAKLEERRDGIDDKKSAFEKGVEDKKKALERQAIFGVALGVLAVAGGVAMVCFGNPGGAAAAAGGASQVAKGASETAKSVNRLVELLKKIAKLLDAIGKLKAYIELLQSLYGSIADPLEAKQRAAAAGKALPEPPSQDDLMNAADWDEFEVTIEAAFQPALEAEIDGAGDYLAELKKLAIRGKDLVVSGSDLERCTQILQQRLWETLRDRDDIKNMETRIAELDAEKGPGMVMLMFYEGLRDKLKFRLIHAIENMSDAYRYYALSEPSVTPSLASSGAELAAMISDIQQDLVTTRERRGTISSWGPERDEREDEASLDQFRRHRSLSWTIDFGSISGLDRIRVSEVRVWLNGPVVSDREDIVLTVGTPGSYRDRYRGRDFEFSAKPLYRWFRYQLDSHGRETSYWGAPVTITMKADDRESIFFQPTVFTTWNIGLPEAENPDLDPGKISGIALEFLGTAIPSRRMMLGGAVDDEVELLGATPQPEKIALFRNAVVL